MPKPDPALLDPALYPFKCLIETRFGDLDTNLHINNVSLTGLLEEGRVRFHREAGTHSRPGDLTSMVASLGIEFLQQSHFPDPLEMNIAVGHIGRTSYRLDQLVHQGVRTVCFAQCVLVCMSQAGPKEISPDYRSRLEQWKTRA